MNQSTNDEKNGQLKRKTNKKQTKKESMLQLLKV